LCRFIFFTSNQCKRIKISDEEDYFAPHNISDIAAKLNSIEQRNPLDLQKTYEHTLTESEEDRLHFIDEQYAKFICAADDDESTVGEPTPRGEESAPVVETHPPPAVENHEKLAEEGEQTQPHIAKKPSLSTLTLCFKQQSGMALPIIH
jgi:hypothetical protein